MLCDHPECTGNHHRYPNLCPRSKETDRIRKQGVLYRERDRARKREAYRDLGGNEYAYLLLKHRRAKALTRMDRRRR